MTDTLQTRGNISTLISNRISKLHRDRYGRGPTSVRTVVGHDHVVTFLEELATPVERTHVDSGETAAVIEVRRAFQRAMKDEFVAIVEEATERKVRAFLSEVTLDPDIDAEIFVLERNHDHPNPAPEGVG